MSDIAVRVEHLSKKYRLGESIRRHTTLRDAIADSLRSPIRNLKQGHRSAKRTPDEILWALRDVSFEVERGGILGIIGRNGSGKSTLLKILSHITEPTGGRAEIYGRVSSILEVGTGFHPELTGRDNIYLNGAILGMRRAEIDRKFDEIVAFAEIEKFLDTPVKRYSSGMYVRLAFAVAAHLEPEILIVDEVLAVGDAAFQKKSLGKMGNVAKEGRTVLFVSHNMIAVRNLCRTGVLLNAGAVSSAGEINQVVNTYLATTRKEILEQRWDTLESAPGNDLVKVKGVKLKPMGETQAGFLTVKTPFQISFNLWVLQPAALNLSMQVKSGSNEVIFASPSPSVNSTTGSIEFTCDIPADLMNDGVYSITLMVVKDSEAIFLMQECLVFEIHEIERAGNWWGKRAGAVRPALNWQHKISTGLIAPNEETANDVA